MAKCPSCRSTQLRRSRLDHGDGLLVPLLLSPYRCIDCERRFFRLSSGAVSMARGTTLFAVVLATILGVVYLTHRVDVSKPAAAQGATRVAGNMGATQSAARAVAGDAATQFELGVRYLTGEGAPRDYVEGRKWLEMAAEGGHVGARYDLGVMYLNGFGVQRNEALAYQWFERAAQQNHADAQYQIALMFKNGVTVPHDLIKSYTWAHISALQGHVGAISLRENLMQVLTQQQIQDGLQAARGWYNNATGKRDGASSPAGSDTKA